MGAKQQRVNVTGRRLEAARCGDPLNVHRVRWVAAAAPNSKGPAFVWQHIAALVENAVSRRSKALAVSRRSKALVGAQSGAACPLAASVRLAPEGWQYG
jgi:hypothetical protein